MPNEAKLMLSKVSDTTDKVCRIFIIVCFSVMVLVCLLQVFCRYILNNSLGWPEEMTIYLMAWMTFIGSAVAVKSSEHIAVDILLSFLPDKIKQMAFLAIRIITLFIVAYLFKASLGLTNESLSMISDALGISMVWPRLGMPLGSAVMALHLINMIVSDIDKMTAEAK
jgi:TRAP-type C4-dicarboxylate transport system permease small subunit